MKFRNKNINKNSSWTSLSGILIFILPFIIAISFLFLNGCRLKNNKNENNDFKTDVDLKDKSIYLSMGYIDDCDEVYVNGHLIGFSGSFPPNYYTAYNVMRMYPCPRDFINFNGDNVVAVRVYDDQLEGGITSGDIAVKTLELMQTDINLEVQWKFI